MTQTMPEMDRQPGGLSDTDPRCQPSRSPRPRVVACVVCAFVVCSCTSAGYSYRQTTSPPDLAPVATVIDETFLLRLRNNTPTPVFLDWASARFVDVLGFERPLRLRSADNVGTPDVPLDPGATIAYQLEPEHYYTPPDRRWARRNSLRNRVTYPDFYAEAPFPRVVVLRLGYCVGAPCGGPDRCCETGAMRAQLEVPLDVTGVNP